MTGGALITGGATITVEAGTEILLAVGASLTVKIDGTLIAIGSASAMITFGPSVPGTIWGGLILEDNGQADYVWDGESGDVPALESSNTATALIYCAFESGGDASRGFNGAITVTRGTPYIQDCVRMPHLPPSLYFTNQ